MSMTAVREGLTARLATISGLRVYATPPHQVAELPAAIIQAGDPLAQHNLALGAADVLYRFKVLLLAQSADGSQAWETLEPFISPTGGGSIKAAVDGTLGGAADWARVVSVPDAGRLTYRQTLYWGAVFLVEAYVSG